MRRLTTSLLILLAGCGITEPEPTLTISGVVRSADGIGVQGATVSVFKWLPEANNPVLASTTTEAQGAFQIELNPPPRDCPTLYLEAEAPGYWATNYVPVGSGTCEGVTSVGGVEIALTPYDPLTITTASLPPAIPTQPYYELLYADGGDQQYRWSLSGGSLPPGLALDSLIGSIRGSPTTSGTWEFSVRVVDGSSHSGERQLSITVADGVVLQPTELCSDYSASAIPTFEDQKLREAVRAAAGVGPSEPLTCGLLADLTSLDASAAEEGVDNFASLVGIQNLSNLTVLVMRGESFLTDISPLGALTQLVELDLSWVGASDISVLAGLTNLQSLDLEGVWIRDLSPLAGLANLTTLTLGSDDVTDLGPLSALPSLKALSIDYTNLADLSPLSAIKSLAELSLQFDQVTDLSPLGQISGLEKVDLRGNFVSDISALGASSGLTDLNLAGNPLRDLSPLTGLTELRTLVLSGDSISDITPLSGLAHLSRLDLYGNLISDIGPVSGLTVLSYLDLSENKISDISALGGLTSLDTLGLNDNSIADVSAVQGLVNLASLGLAGNSGLSDIQAILDNTGIGAGDWVDLEQTAVTCGDVNALRARGVIAVATGCI